MDMSLEPHIESANGDDLSEIVVLFNTSRASMKYLPVVHTQAETNQYFISLIEKRKIRIVKKNNVIVGFMQLEDGWLHHLYIDLKFQNMGFGKLLLEEAKKLSPKEIQLWVFEENSGAIQFYEREGFVLAEK
jgi:GNAT superfamily N-acetyltransferase